MHECKKIEAIKKGKDIKCNCHKIGHAVKDCRKDVSKSCKIYKKTNQTEKDCFF